MKERIKNMTNLKQKIEKILTGKDYNKAMEDMECWNAQCHIKKCKKCNRDSWYWQDNWDNSYR